MNTHQCKLGKQFLSHAVEFIRASQRLRSQKPFLYHPTFYCALHGLELALKSHLAADGFSKARLAGRKLGHDLDSLLTHVPEVRERFAAAAHSDGPANRESRLE